MPTDTLPSGERPSGERVPSAGAYSLVPASEVHARIAAVQTGLAAQSIDALVVVQQADLYYLTGTTQQCHLLVPAEGPPRLLVRKVLERAQQETSIDDVRPMRSLKELPAQLAEVCGGEAPRRIAFELDVIPVAQFKAYERVLESAEFVDGSRIVLAVRSQKSAWEIEQLRDAAQLHVRVFAEIPEILKRAKTSYDLQTALNTRSAELGHCGVIRMRGLDVSCGVGVVVTGKDGAIPSHSMFPIGGRGTHPYVAAGGSWAPIEDDTPIIVDYLMNTTGYHADCTRMAVRGDVSDGAAEIYAKTRSILKLAESRLRPGAIPSEIYAECVDEAASLGLADGFMGPKGYQVRFVGHSVGVEVNEAPVLAPRFDEPLAVGNTLAVEPKFTHPEWGVLGIENTYAVTADGAENLTQVDEEFIR